MWATRWLEDKIREQRVRLGELREGLGRLQFLAGPLEHIRPFLGPLYAWACAGPRERMARCPSRALDMGEVFRLDAKAEGEQVAIGGWRCKGAASTKEAAWFAVKLNRRNAPWAFARGEAFRTMASLELLGVLVGVMVLMPKVTVTAETIGSITLTCGTDNQGNMFLMDKLLTTKYPLGVVLMELASQLGRRAATLRADWIPRLQNEEADALTNWEFRHFDPEKRIEVDLDKLDFHVLRDLFLAGDDYLSELERLKAQGKAASTESGPPQRAKKARRGESLRERDPW